MRYDADIIVIGAGPAGMAAALRSRWVKSSNMLPASVLLLDPAGPGGIAAMGTVFLVGPWWQFNGDLPAKHLIGDLRRLEIPIVREAAVALETDGDFWTVTTPARIYRSLAVVLAAGLRRLTDEPDIRAAKGLTFLSGGYERAAERFMQWSDTHAGQRMLLIGGATLAPAMAELRAYDARRNELLAVYEPVQTVRGYARDGEVITVTVETHGRLQQLACEHVMLDYHSLESAPPSLAFLPAAWRTQAGYSAVGPVGDATLPGLFAAGDCAGMPSMCVKALAQGAEAGLHAYRYVYQRKFGEAPHLFAFFPSPDRPPLAVREIPPIDPERHQPVGLIAASRFPTRLDAPDVGWSDEDRATLLEEIGTRSATVHLR
jgi:thioredoxin reductase